MFLLNQGLKLMIICLNKFTIQNVPIKSLFTPVVHMQQEIFTIQNVPIK